MVSSPRALRARRRRPARLNEGQRAGDGAHLIALEHHERGRYSQWTLDYLRVLAWPVVVLIALILFRYPLASMFEESTLESGGFGPLNFRFRGRQTEADIQGFLAAVQEETGAEIEDLQAQLATRDYWLEIAGLLLQTFEVQLGFLRHLPASDDQMTGSEAERWFDKALRPAIDAGASFDVPALVGWLQSRGLIELSADGRYEVTAKGEDLLTISTGMWYVPKVV